MLAFIGLLDASGSATTKSPPDNVVHFMALDRSESRSIYTCLRAARENAHAVRGTLTAEMWETINTTWLELARIQARTDRCRSARTFFEWVKLRSRQSRGVTLSRTMLRDDAFRFMRLGTFIERADNTARILDVKYNFIAEAPRRDEASEYYQWSALLHSVLAFEIYRKVYRDQITPSRVAELLVLR